MIAPFLQQEAEDLLRDFGNAPGQKLTRERLAAKSPDTECLLQSLLKENLVKLADPVAVSASPDYIHVGCTYTAYQLTGEGRFYLHYMQRLLEQKQEQEQKLAELDKKHQAERTKDERKGLLRELFITAVGVGLSLLCSNFIQ